jgi:hypothetical protein
MAAGIKRQHEPPRIVGDLLQTVDPARLTNAAVLAGAALIAPLPTLAGDTGCRRRRYRQA